MSAAKELYDLMMGMQVKPGEIFPAIVTEVTGDTITVDAGGYKYYDVGLKAIVADGLKGIKVTPAIGSVVLVRKIDDGKSGVFICIMYSEINEHSIDIDTVKYLMDAEGFLFQKGNDTIKETFTLIIEAVKAIIVLQGRNPDRIKLEQALTKVNNLFK